MQPANPHANRPANRLAGESSPYLLQHAHNPVDWWPWGEGAFAEARRRGVPIFLSIGYSTCYWCHVMERESFESEAIARLMSQHFVCVKVDREERPDVDDLYMTATQIMTGRGGWPMSCFLEPEKLRPFWCGTYFPPEPRMGMPGFPQVLEGMSVAWTTKRSEVHEQAEAVAAAVGEQLAQAQAPVGVGLEQVSTAAQSLLRMLDRTHGGFGGAPKFPQPAFLELLLDVRDSAGDDATRSSIDEAVRLTLDRMACGGINDQVGGGFHRYSVDEKWLVPHFEKMLYDNAQLAAVYARAARTYTDSFYERTARRTLDYVLREMTSPEGGFFSAQDAEVDGREGANYVWTEAEVRAVLSPDDAALAMRVYGLDEGPNFRDPHHPQAAPTSILKLGGRPEQVATRLGIEPSELLTRLDAINARLYEVRSARTQPRLDDKVLCGWNGLMIAAFARAGLGFGEARYVQAAAKAAEFILARMRDGDGDLLRVSRAGAAKTPAVLEDYAFFIHGLIAIHASDAKARELRGALTADAALTQAAQLAASAGVLFGSARGGFFDTRADQSDLFLRASSTHDGAIPAGSSVMLHNLIELYTVTGQEPYLDSAVAALASHSAAIASSPLAAANATRGILTLISARRDIEGQLARLGPAAMSQEAQLPEGFTPVEVFASTERVSVAPDHPAELKLVLRIKDGYHINAADPGPGGAGLVPLRVGVVHGRGIVAYADYPAGEPYGANGELRVHRGSVEFAVAVERHGEWAGRPLLSVTYQACTETECLAPMTVELDVSIDQVG